MLTVKKVCVLFSIWFSSQNIVYLLGPRANSPVTVAVPPHAFCPFLTRTCTWCAPSPVLDTLRCSVHESCLSWQFGIDSL